MHLHINPPRKEQFDSKVLLEVRFTILIVLILKKGEMRHSLPAPLTITEKQSTLPTLYSDKHLHPIPN